MRKDPREPEPCMVDLNLMWGSSFHGQPAAAPQPGGEGLQALSLGAVLAWLIGARLSFAPSFVHKFTPETSMYPNPLLLFFFWVFPSTIPIPALTEVGEGSLPTSTGGDGRSRGWVSWWSQGSLSCYAFYLLCGTLSRGLPPRLNSWAMFLVEWSEMWDMPAGPFPPRHLSLDWGVVRASRSF